MRVEPAQPHFEVLYHRAFAEYRVHALWNLREIEHPTPEEALIITRGLRIEGDLNARCLAEQIEQACVPLSKIQSDVLRLLAAHRDPESYVAEGTPLNRGGPRFSADIDVFHDREERVAQAALADAAALQSAGYEVNWLRQLPLIYTAAVAGGNASTRLEWVVDSDFRFFPVAPDEIFGYVLHPADLATNKVMAAAGRREVRDLVDLVTIHQSIVPLGAIIWAAVEKSPGFTPEGLIAEIRRNSRYLTAEWSALISSEPIDPEATLRGLRGALDEAEAFVFGMPTQMAGLLFLENGRVVQPVSSRLREYQTHAGQRRGHWPASGEISAAMLEKYGESPP